MAIDVNNKFGKFFSGANWSHDEFYGVGVEFVGFPNDVEKFTELLLNHSCNPIATQRIIKELEVNNKKITTLMFGLPFKQIGEDLEILNVKMVIVAPLLNQDLLNKDINDAYALEVVKNNKELPSNLPDIEDILKRRDVFLTNVDKYSIKNKYGCYN